MSASRGNAKRSGESDYRRTWRSVRQVFLGKHSLTRVFFFSVAGLGMDCGPPPALFVSDGGCLERMRRR
jgi:hypothetical protein